MDMVWSEETIQVQESRKAVHDLLQENTIWLSFDIYLTTTVTWIYVLRVLDHNGRLKGMLVRHRSLLHRGRSAVSCDRPIVPIEAYRQKQLLAGHAVLDDHCALGHL